MNKQRMIRMLNDARAAVLEAGLFGTLVQQLKVDGEIVNETSVTKGTQNLIGQLILASAIEGSGESISMSLDKLDKVALELSEIARAAKMVGH